MFTHILIGTNDPDKSQAFYDATMGALGIMGMRMGERAYYRQGDGPAFGVGRPANGEPATFGNGGTLGFKAADKAAVDAWHAAGLANGGSDEGAPGKRASGPGNAYGAYLRDPDGNKLCTFCQLPAASELKSRGEKAMYSHNMVGTNDVEKSKQFYDAVFTAIGGRAGMKDDKGRLIYMHNNGLFMVTPPIDGQPATPGNGCTVGFAMDSAEQANAWHAAGVANGGTAIEDPPGVREASFGKLYLAYLRDPDGNKLCALQRM